MDLQLINAPVPSDLVSCLRSKAYPPLSLLSLATYIKNKHPGLLIEILDGEIIPLQEIYNKLCAPIIGISSNSFSYPIAIEIAEHIKTNYPETKTVLGGVHATNIPEIILKKRKCFDILVEGQGELAINKIVEGGPLNSTPNCWFRDLISGNIHHTFRSFTPIENLPFPNYELIDLNPYFLNFANKYRSKSDRNGVSIISSTGCNWRLSTGGCVFCSIPNAKFSSLPATIFWKLAENVFERSKASFIWDVSDNFIFSKDRIFRLKKLHPKLFPVVFHVYARPENIDERTGEALADIGIAEVLLGAESLSNLILQKANKGTNKKAILKSIEILSSFGIKIAISLILGLPGENEISLKETLEECYRLSENKNIIECHSGILIPTPGSQIFSGMLMNKQFYRKYGNLDIIPFDDMMNDYLLNYTLCGPDPIFDCYAKIDALFPSGGPFYLNRKTKLNEKIAYKESYV